jgi:hypothetical protein
MKRIATVLVTLAAGLAQADTGKDPELIAFLERQGCTIGPHSRAVAKDAGFGPARVDALAAASLRDGLARQEGDHVVLAAGLCTIRLPVVESPLALDDPALAPYVQVVAGPDLYDRPGCFLSQGDFFAQRFAEDPGSDQLGPFTAFTAAGILSGELRYVSFDPVDVPPEFQILTGDCADVPEAADLRWSHQFITDTNFDRFVRGLAAATDCTSDHPEVAGPRVALELQGLDPEADALPAPPVNVVMFTEWTFLLMASDWYDAARMQHQGEARPPLCHYRPG